MYGVIKDNELIAIHDDKDVVYQFIIDNKDEAMVIIKIKDRAIAKIKNYEGIYLVRYNDSYIQYDLYSTLKNISNESTYDLKYCRDILYRILEDPEMSDSDSHHVRQVIKIISNQIDDILNQTISTDTLTEIHDLNQSYKNKI